MSTSVGDVAERPSTLEIWYLAARPKTLPAAIAPIVVGTSVAVHEGGFVWWVALLALATALLLQIAANFANDALDAKRGSDTPDRTGPTRVTSAGFVTYKQVMNATWITLVLAMCTGIPLLVRGGWPFVFLGIACLVCAVAYTGGPFPISYLGLGEIFVFLFFGIIAVTGTAYLQTQELTALALAASIPPGMMSVGILTTNNYRDLEQDRIANKRTVAVRIGAANTRIQYYAVLVITALTPLVFWAIGWLNGWALLTVLAWPLLWQLAQQFRTQTGPALNKTLGQTGQTALIHSLLFGMALVLTA